MKLDCREAELRIQPYLDRTLNDRECKEFLHHIRGCKECRSRLETGFLVEHALEYLDESDRDSFDIEKLLNEDITKVERGILMGKITEFLTWAGIVIMAVVIGLIALRIFAPQLLKILGDRMLDLLGIDTDYSFFELLRLRVTGSV